LERFDSRKTTAVTPAPRGNANFVCSNGTPGITITSGGPGDVYTFVFDVQGLGSAPTTNSHPNEPGRRRLGDLQRRVAIGTPEPAFFDVAARPRPGRLAVPAPQALVNGPKKDQSSQGSWRLVSNSFFYLSWAIFGQPATDSTDSGLFNEQFHGLLWLRLPVPYVLMLFPILLPKKYPTEAIR